MWIENTGVAPIYWPYKLALRLKQEQGEEVFPASPDIREWLPGDAWIEEKVQVPKKFGKGGAMLYAGLAHPATLEPKVLFANEGVKDGWLPLGKVSIE